MRFAALRNIVGTTVPMAVAAFCVVTLLLAVMTAHSAEEAKPASPPRPEPSVAQTKLDANSTFAAGVQPYLKKYCIDCHGGDEPEAGLRLDKFRSELEAGRQPVQWEKVEQMLQKRSMPPADHEPRPMEEENQLVLGWIDRMFHHVDCDKARDPGRVTARRLNRVEYNNTIRDLMGVDFKPAADFPTDDVGYGFDNIGDVLTLSPLLMEKYMDAAEQIASRALSTEALTKPHVQRKEGEQLSGTGSAKLNQYGFHMLSSAGTVFGEFDFPFKGEYEIRARVTADQAGPEPVKMAYKLDNKLVQTIEVTRHKEAGFFETKVKVLKGKFPFAVEFLNDFYDPKGPDPEHQDRNLGVHLLEVVGPFGVTHEQARTLLPETHKRIVFCSPDAKGSVEDCARKILREFGRRAYRRPVTDAELNDLVALVKLAIDKGETFDGAIQVGVQGVLVSPNFLFRIERDSDPNDPRAAHSIADYELASRLSYFLWSTMPDEELFALAEKAELHKPDVLEAQVRRMLADPRSRALVDNFASQWLNLRNLDIATPNQKLFESFNDDLRADMRRETEMLFETVMREDLSIFTFLDADFTFVNERLAKYYDIKDVQGGEFRKVSLAGSKRTGVLTHGSILTLTSDPTKTSPVKRGKWILENILGTPPPPPPAKVPDFAEAQKAKPDATLREQLELHRSNAVCASCHKTMDPLGLALENFDAVGRWRDKDRDKPIDASGTLPSGEKIQNAGELIRVLRGREEEFTKHFVRTLLTYALGRGLEYYDKCAVDGITSAVRSGHGRFSQVVIHIVRSEPFLMRRGDGGEE